MVNIPSVSMLNTGTRGTFWKNNPTQFHIIRSLIFLCIITAQYFVVSSVSIIISIAVAIVNLVFYRLFFVCEPFNLILPFHLNFHFVGQ